MGISTWIGVYSRAKNEEWDDGRGIGVLIAFFSGFVLAFSHLVSFLAWVNYFIIRRLAWYLY